MASNFSPGSIFLGNSGGATGRSPYLPVNNPARPTNRPIAPNNAGSAYSGGPGNYLPGAKKPLAPGQPVGIIRPTAVRATQGGPFDQAYRQNLATYAGGTLTGAKNGLLQFDPTNPNSLQGPGTDAGNAPVPGMPSTFLSQALGGQPTAMPYTTMFGPGSLASWLQGLSQGYNGQPQQPPNSNQGYNYGY